MNFFVNRIKLCIEGKNVERFIHRLVNNKIELLKIKPISYKKTIIIIYKKDYEEVLNLKQVYDITLLDSYGLIKMKEVVVKKRILYIGILFGLCLLIFLSNIIFSVDIISTNSNLRNIVKKDLELNGIKKYRLIKSYKKINTIKEKILDNNKDKIEWIEIERRGTKYIIRLEERKINSNQTDNSYGHIVAKKSAIIKQITANNGELIKYINDYVKEDDIIISGDISLNGILKNQVKASGEVFGEVWYTVNVDYPFIYYEEKFTGKQKSVYGLNILNKRFELFNIHPFKDKVKTEKTIIKSNFLPIRLVKEYQKEIILIQEFHTYDTLIKKAEQLALSKMQSQLNDKEYIISQKNLKVEVKDSRMNVEVFFSVYENITKFNKIP